MTDRDHFAAAALTGLLSQCAAEDREAAETAAAAMRYADAMLRERAKTNHDAAPAAIANAESVAPQPTARGESDRNDKAAPRPSAGTGDTPAAHATRGEGSEQRECTEPVAWAVCTPGDGDWSPCFFREPHAQRCANAIVGEKNVVPLYRSPTLTDAEREAIYRASQYLSQNDVFEGMAEDAATLRGLLSRLT